MAVTKPLAAPCSTATLKVKGARLNHRHCTKKPKQAPSSVVRPLRFTQRSEGLDLSDTVSNAALQDT